jgi:hypothetical protein
MSLFCPRYVKPLCKNDVLLYGCRTAGGNAIAISLLINKEKPSAKTEGFFVLINF